MIKNSATKALSHGRGPHGATHPPWAFRKDAALWFDGVPIAVNMLPLASEMSEWLRQKRNGLSACFEGDRQGLMAATNPYTYQTSTIGLLLADVINEAWEFANQTGEIHEVQAEVQRLRLSNELALYSARYCEATIKQMLYCTQVPRRLYKRAGLGQLLAMDCVDCRRAERPHHDVSLLGALAHQYFLCFEFDRCIVDHLPLVAKRRNLEAAHAESPLLDPKGTAQSRSCLHKVLNEIGDSLVHMMGHIGKIESRMIDELQLITEMHPGHPDPAAFMKIPARPRLLSAQSQT